MCLNMKSFKLIIGVVLFLVLTANYNWVHAAFVYGASSTTCSETHLTTAQSRIQKLFGAVHSDPWIRCLEKPVLGLGHTIGTTHFAPGVPAIIILAPEGNQPDVLAHEWAHAHLNLGMPLRKPGRDSGLPENYWE